VIEESESLPLLLIKGSNLKNRRRDQIEYRRGTFHHLANERKGAATLEIGSADTLHKETNRVLSTLDTSTERERLYIYRKKKKNPSLLCDLIHTHPLSACYLS
jgi:hypothetical protein